MHWLHMPSWMGPVPVEVVHRRPRPMSPAPVVWVVHSGATPSPTHLAAPSSRRRHPLRRTRPRPR